MWEAAGLHSLLFPTLSKITHCTSLARESYHISSPLRSAQYPTAKSVDKAPNTHRLELSMGTINIKFFGSVPTKDKVLCSFRPILGDGRLNEVWAGRS